MTFSNILFGTLVSATELNATEMRDRFTDLNLDQVFATITATLQPVRSARSILIAWQCALTRWSGVRPTGWLAHAAASTRKYRLSYQSLKGRLAS